MSRMITISVPDDLHARIVALRTGGILKVNVSPVCAAALLAEVERLEALLADIKRNRPK